MVVLVKISRVVNEQNGVGGAPFEYYTFSTNSGTADASVAA